MNTFLAERLGIGIHRPEFTVNRNCPPGLHSALWWVAKVQLTRGAGQACFADWGTLAACLTALKLLNTLAARFTGCLHLRHGQGLACWCLQVSLLAAQAGRTVPTPCQKGERPHCQGVQVSVLRSQGVHRRHQQSECLKLAPIHREAFGRATDSSSASTLLGSDAPQGTP